jgi:hypothetical protein
MIFIFSATTHADEMSLSEFQSKISVIHSHAWFKGFFYTGSDDKYHYFTEEWDFKIDPKYKVKKDQLSLTVEFYLGERKLGFSPIEGYGYKVFFDIDGRKYFIWE